MVWLHVRRWVVRPVIWALVLVALSALALSAYLRSGAVREKLARYAEREVARVIGRAVASWRAGYHERTRTGRGARSRP